MNLETSQPVISARDLTRIYTLGDSEVIGISRVDLEIAAGALVVLKGNSGSGKSTLLSLLAGLDRPTRGDLTVANHDLNKTSDNDLTHFRRQVVGMIFQSFNLLPTLNALENICLPAKVGQLAIGCLVQVMAGDDQFTPGGLIQACQQ